MPVRKTVLAGIILCFLAAGCGVKEWPSVPMQVVPEAVRLSIETSGRRVKLTWTVSQGSSVRVAGTRVFRSSVHVSDDCKNCPVAFSKVADIPYDNATMIYTDTIEKDYRYKYKLVCYTDRGVFGKDSNIVEAIGE